ncbi:uncharacterized protein LOC111082243 [Drosophila obscura]|uniref:uncharacterized protein LOC111082243 n=1 Tax=Drosophila obscura TaxID=7282 RepID=UPI001BB13E26|nr:uncharacterized protein LOC111082243 [Drosophila obscura]
MRSLLFVCTAALLLWGNVAEKEQTKSPKVDEAESIVPPKADEPAPKKSRKADEPDEPSKWFWQRPRRYGRLTTKKSHDLILLTNYWEDKQKYTEQAIQRLDIKIPELRRKYELSIEKNRTLATTLELTKRNFHKVTLELKTAEQQRDKCRDIQRKMDIQLKGNNPNKDEYDKENLTAAVGRHYTNRYIRLLKNLRVTIDRELKIVTNSLWKKIGRKNEKINAKFPTSKNEN